MMSSEIIEKLSGGLRGTIKLSGDKSISHRSIMLASLCNNSVAIKNFLYARDCLSTVSCLQKLGVKIERHEDDTIKVYGVGLKGLREPQSILNAGNSGTTLRLLLGILSAQPFFTALTGDASLSKRPMGRVIRPLSKMGGKIFGREKDLLLPICVLPAEKKLHHINYEMKIPSAQVKSAILLAGLFADAPTTITCAQKSRDHTERMLFSFGAKLYRQENRLTIYPATSLHGPQEIIIPGDISAAAYWIVAASIIKNSEIIIENVGINPTRTGIVDVLLQMGAKITCLNRREVSGEPVADIHVRSADLHGIRIDASYIPRLIDEVPILAVAALFAQGTTIISGAAELRVKECDRLSAIATEFSKLSSGIIEREDGLIIEGNSSFLPAQCSSHHDHRIAMSLAILGAAANGVKIDDASCVNISYPNFFTDFLNLQRNKL